MEDNEKEWAMAYRSELCMRVSTLTITVKLVSGFLKIECLKGQEHII